VNWVKGVTKYLSAELSAFEDGRSIGIDPWKIAPFRKDCLKEAYDQVDDALPEKKKFMMEQEIIRAAEDQMYR